MRKKNVEEDEIPKSVLKMKQEKARREEEERNRRQGKTITNTEKRRGRKSKEQIKEEKKQKRKKLRRKIIVFILLILLIIIGISLGVSAYSWNRLTKDMFLNENSVVVDTDGDIIATLGAEQKKLTVDFEDIPDNLVNAYVAIEDERFYSHHGIDIKRTGGAILSYITHFGNSSYGGSTITQQLVKNLTGDNSDSITRKVKEWWKAFLLECYYSKDEILEMYLNVIYVGPNIYGVQTGANYYFDKDVSDLSLAECAYLAGINNSPNSYNPFEDSDNSELITNRTLTVLKKMLELGYIEEDEYEDAEKEVNAGLDFDRGKIESENPIYSYHTDALITEVIADLAEDNNITETFAQNYLYLGGLTIHSTQDSNIQDEVEAEFLKSQYLLESSDGESTSQAAMVIMNHTNGKIVACVGGLGEKEYFRGLNRATQSQRQTGSSIKPLAVLVPGIDRKIFTASTIYNDEKTTFVEGYAPGNNDGYLGEIMVRRALESSQNVPFVEMMEEIGPARAISYLENMGITSLTEEDESLGLALGGLQNGITPLEMAAAYATIANDGEYIEPTFYTSITNNDGKIVLRAKQETRNVFSEQVAYIVKELLTQPVEGSHGTATYCSISGIEVAAKTGTTDDNYDKWLCGFTPYYTAVTWFGFDQNESIYYNNQNPAGIIWANVMRRVHNGLQNISFVKPGSIDTEIICAETGMLARTGCTNTYEEYFLRGTAPELCNEHSGSKASSSTSNNTSQSTGVYRDNEEELELDPNDEEEVRVENEVENNIVNNSNNDVVDNTETAQENIVEENTVEENIINDTGNNTDNEPEQGNNISGSETTPDVSQNTISGTGQGDESGDIENVPVQEETNSVE